jgi:hypothetical protein
MKIRFETTILNVACILLFRKLRLSPVQLQVIQYFLYDVIKERLSKMGDISAVRGFLIGALTKAVRGR